MKKIVDMIKRNYIAFTIFMVIFLVIIASIITISVISHNRHKIVTENETISLYQYIGKMKNSFEADITYEDGQITKISSSKYSIVDSIIYYKDKDQAIVPYDSEIVFYYRDNLTYQLPKYSTLGSNKSLKTINVEGIDYSVDNFIIYDGKDNYFLPDASTLTLDGEKIELSPLSYIEANRATLIYYDYAKNKITVKENVKVANLKINDANIDLFGDVVVYNNKSMLLDSDVKKYSIYKVEKED